MDRDAGPPLAERWPRPSARALLKLLAVSPGHSLHREQAMDICWPDADPQAATGSLRVALHAARRAIEPELAPRAASSYLLGEGALLRLEPQTVWIDADHAETLAERALGDGGSGPLAEALAAFTGELLPEDRYAPWAEARRERLGSLRERVTLGLAEAHLSEGSPEEAAAAAEQVLLTSPAEEQAHQVLIEAYVRQGLRRKAVRQYHLCREALDAELGVRPGSETERLHQSALSAAPVLRPSAPVLPAAIRNPAPTPLRGRDDVLRALLSPDAPPVQLLTGEAGLGKTRLVGEAARIAAAEGTAVLWGAGHDAEGHTPYGAFAEALDGWLADRPTAERAGAGAEYPELASLLPSLGRVRSLADRSPEEERDRLFRATAGLLGELADQHPVLVVLDDLHAADAGSFQLLSHLARRAADAGAPWRFAVTCREEELAETDPRRAGLAALVRQGLARRIELTRLDRDACLTVAADVGTATDRVWELSLGNPLFAVELARSLGESTAPDTVRQLVAERLGRVAPVARRMVEALSASGGEASLSEVLDVAERGLRMAGTEAADALEEAIAAALVVERQVVVDGRPVAGLAFRHPLVRLTCYEQLSTVRRRQLHSAFAEAVLRHRPDAVDALASHFARADDPRAAEYLRRAAERAAALYANDTADRYYRDLVARLDVDAARARLAHSHVLRRMGHFAEAAAALREALAEFGRRGERDDEVLAAGHLAETLVKARTPLFGAEILRAYPPGPDTAAEPAATHHTARSVVFFVQGQYEEGHAAAVQALDAARGMTGLSGQGLVARAFAMQASNLGLAGRFNEARAAADRALAPAEAYGDPTLLTSVLSILRENARRGGRLREAISTGRRALDLAERSGDPTATAFERANLAELHLLMEEFDEALTHAEEAVRGAESNGEWCLAYALAALARVRMRTGGESEAAALLERAEKAATERNDRQAHHEARTARVELALRARQPEDALRLLGGVDPADSPLLAAWAHVSAGRHEQSASLAAPEAERAAQAGERITEIEVRVVHALALARLGRPAEAAEALALAEEPARDLPYPAGLRRVAEVRELM
ncbi:ATP-binding protein [Streptomyces sp. NBC_01465]|uniref:ATP-binding protein n=1 Tax=Streptomyces sp. NBC_01465 TaxID=2903878 RepID=UPI002E36DB2C|nr:AAA family ATPase [Streptomyces sp. NBC_01465]